MKMHQGVYDTHPETATEFPRGPVIEMDDGKCIFFDLYMEKEAELCLQALSANQLAEQGLPK